MKKSLPAEDLDRLFDNGEDLTEYVDRDSTRHLNLAVKRINVDMPVWMVEALDREAARLNVSRQAVLKTKLDIALKAEAARHF